MKNHLIAEELARVFTERASNEANTRHQIINRLLHEVLAWPIESVDCEQPVHEGYVDFILKDKAKRAVLLIEAKKEGIYFNLPIKVQKGGIRINYIRLRTLATDPQIAAAVYQAAKYCPSIGCQQACITNGHEFIIFRSFIPGKNFMDADAIVIPSLAFFSERFTQAYNLLSYDAVTANRSLQIELGLRKGGSKDLLHPKNGISHYDSPFQKNPYAKYLEPIAKRYFGEISPTDLRLMDHCYVFARDTKQVQDGIHKRVADSLSPYFKADGASEIAEIRSGGKLSQRVARSLGKQSPGEVLILYGGKGAGKSTFLRRLMYYEPPQDFVIHAFPIVVDCLKAPQEKEALTRHLWEKIIAALNLDGLLERPMHDLLNLFEDKFKLAEKQELAGYTAGSPEYLKERNILIQKWRSDELYVARRLKAHWEKQGKSAVIAFDNTDQLPPLLQDHCFLSAHNISRELRSVVIISMREERYCRARTAGVLDAYENSGFHLAAPDLVGVFTKRLKLVIHDLRDNGHPDMRSVLPEDAPIPEIQAFFLCCLRQFGEDRNALEKFLQECSRDNTRLALDFFAQFLSSGYTHVEEMVMNARWTVSEHQVIKPMMIPQRFNYDEDKSLVPNLFQCRNSAAGSHFTTQRILKSLASGVTAVPDKSGYLRVDALLDEFDSKFGMRQDCEAALDIMLRHGLLEANNRLDAYKVEKTGGSDNEMIFADEVRITAFGAYALDYLAPAFTYLDLVSLDCGISDERIYSEFCVSATEERSMALRGDKMGRVISRLDRVSRFITYLEDEEAREKTEFLLSDAEDFMPKIRASFEAERLRVLASAKRNIDPVTQDDFGYDEGSIPRNS